FDISYPSLARGSTVVPASTPADRLRGLARAQRLFHAAVSTSMVDALCGPDDVALLAEASRTGQLTLRVAMLVAFPHYDRIAALRPHSGLGDERLRLLGVKSFVDGACAGGNCLVDEPFEGTDDH